MLPQYTYMSQATKVPKLTQNQTPKERSTAFYIMSVLLPYQLKLLAEKKLMTGRNDCASDVLLFDIRDQNWGSPSKCLIRFRLFVLWIVVVDILCVVVMCYCSLG